MKKEIIKLPDAELEYFSEFLSAEESDSRLKDLLNLPHWRQDHIKIFGKEMLQPRLTILFGEKGKTYTYSGLKMHPIAFPSELLALKNKCEKFCETRFTTCLANLYRNGSDSMGWHADDEKELGENPVIASVSFGAERIFQLKHKKIPSENNKIRLQHGSLLIMKGTTQQFWKHQLPKTKKEVGSRINLTFRKILYE